MDARKVNVLIAGVGGGGNGYEILKTLRISDINYTICGCDMAKKNIGFCKADKHFVVPPANDPRYLEVLLDICKKEKIQILFPGSEPDLKSISDNRCIFEETGIFLPLNNKNIIDLCMNKKETFKKLESEGLPIPKTISIERNENLSSVDYFPVVVKPYLGGGGSNNTFIAQDHEELNFFCNYIIKYGGKPLVQEYMGTYENEYTIGVLSGLNGGVISVVGMRRFIMSGLSNRLKVRSLKNKEQVLAISSGISQGEIVVDNSLNQQCITIAKCLRSTGPINIQCRCVDGIVYPFEINPRFSGTTYMRALAGVNEPDLFIRKHFLNEDIGAVPLPRTNLILRGLEEVVINQIN